MNGCLCVVWPPPANTRRTLLRTMCRVAYEEAETVTETAAAATTTTTVSVAVVVASCGLRHGLTSAINETGTNTYERNEHNSSRPSVYACR